MSNVFFISDTHLGHTNILKFCREEFETIEHHDQNIIEQWNKVVRSRDIVWHLGDVALEREALQQVRQLNGRKRLIMGNHDVFPIQDYIDADFEQIYGVHKKYGMIMSHVPIHTRQMEFRWKFNVHGHIHMEEHVLEDERYYNVCCDFHGLAPISLDAVRKFLNTKINKE